ncbi:MAG TPA: multidrug effflux MFS transporter [Cytophagales bacterium]|nr:multidrug effflux MFS transporter [Cytophagales bacterium]
MTGKKYFVLILVLGALTTISPFSIDMYLPGFPAIAKDLNTSIADIQLSLTSYLIGVSLGQMIYGPLLDRFGRKVPLYIGLLIYIFTSLGCAVTNSSDALIIMRFLQAIGGCVGMVASQALVRDIFPKTETAKVFSLLILVVSVSPMIAPTVGGYVTTIFGWESIFIILAIITALILVSLFFVLPEGRKPDKSFSLKPGPVINGFLTVTKNPQFLTYSLVGGIASAALFAYITGSPEVFITIYNFSEREYGFLFAFFSVGVIGSTQLNHILLKRFSSEEIISVALSYQTFIGILLLTGAYFDWYNKYILILLLFVFLTGQGLISPNSSALSLAPFSRLTGSASALLGSLRMGLGGLISGIVSVLHNRTVIPMLGVMATCSLIGFILLNISKRRFPIKEPEEGVEEETVIL